MLVNVTQKTNKVSEVVVSIRVSSDDAKLLDELVASAKVQGLVSNKSAFIRYVLNDYATRHVAVSEVSNP
jgi:hypothetical protein